MERVCKGIARSVFLFWRGFGEGRRERRVVVAEDRARGRKT